MRHGRRTWIAAVCWVAAVLMNGHLQADPESLPSEMLHDAALHDIFFLDAQRGWAVGDRGVIWLTEDGGRQWQLADSPVNCPLYSVSFVDAKLGWAVGGWIHPYGHRTSAVVLRTENGGQRWTRVDAPTLPRLFKVRFFDKRLGWAVGTPSDMYPSGVFHTTDGGRSWSSVPADQRAGWLAADFVQPDRGLVAGRDGAVATVQREMVAAAQSPLSGLRHVHVARATATGRMWLAGDGGLVTMTPDLGRTWLTPQLPMTAESVRQIDFRALAMRGDTVWLAGNPGSCLFRSRDGGQSWQTLHTQHPLPIHALAFADEQRGWAAGAFGTILVTQDAGDSWQVQRAGGSRAALLGLFSEPERVSLELLTELCGNEGYLGAIELLTRRDVEAATPVDELRGTRAGSGVLAAGGSYTNATWRFPLRQAGLEWPTATISAGWTIANQSDGLQALEEHITLRIRQWRPDILVTEGSATESSQLSQLIQQAVLAAAEHAADSEAHIEQLSVLGLQPWKVPKIVATADSESPSAIVLDTSRLATHLGCPVRDHSTACRGFTRDDWSPVPSKVAFELLASDVPRAVAVRDFFDGALLSTGSEARRPLGAPASVSLTGLNRASQKQRAVERLVTSATDESQAVSDWQAQLDDLTRDLPPGAAGELLFQLAQHYREMGHYQLAADTLLALTNKVPHHPLTEPALEWLVQYHASAEAQKVFGTVTNRSTNSPGVEVAVAEFNAALPPGVNRQLEITQFDSAPPRLAAFDGQLTGESLTSLATTLQQTRPALYAEPQIRMALAAALRRRSDHFGAQRLYQQLAANQPPGAWRQSARAELWLDRRTGHPPKPALACLRTDQKPVLDGQLDDEAWRRSSATQLRSPLEDDETWPATIWLSRDDEFFYLAIECRKAPGCEYPSSAEPRPRDPDLSQQDRIELLLDVDRDYSSALRFTVDHRGWTGEACWGDRRWNPTWHVAAASDSESWRAEAAIPLDQLTDSPITAGEVWGLGLQRQVPGLGFQSWSQPANTTGRAEGFGLLMLE